MLKITIFRKKRGLPIDRERIKQGVAEVILFEKALVGDEAWHEFNDLVLCREKSIGEYIELKVEYNAATNGIVVEQVKFLPSIKLFTENNAGKRSKELEKVIFNAVNAGLGSAQRRSSFYFCSIDEAKNSANNSPRVRRQRGSFRPHAVQWSH